MIMTGIVDRTKLSEWTDEGGSLIKSWIDKGLVDQPVDKWRRKLG